MLRGWGLLRRLGTLKTRSLQSASTEPASVTAPELQAGNYYLGPSKGTGTAIVLWSPTDWYHIMLGPRSNTRIDLVTFCSKRQLRKLIAQVYHRLHHYLRFTQIGCTFRHLGAHALAADHSSQVQHDRPGSKY
jgi:hypothetical protein